MSTSAAISELKEGMTLGPYRIERKIGQGGMGHVFLAVEERLGRKVALKTLAAWATHDQDSLTRFSSEAKALAMVRHPNVVTVHASDCIGGVHFIAMEYIEGVPLSEVCMNLALPAVEAVPLILQVLEGLSALHDKAIIHRDIKPQNLLLQRDGLVKIVDLGVAKIYAESSVQTVAGIVLGTGNYLAPEVAAGQPATTRSDLWATGAVLYELMTGTPLVPGRNLVDSLRLLASFELRFPQESLTWIPAEIRDLIKRMCARDPQERWASARELIHLLKSWLKRQPAHAQPLYPLLSLPIRNATHTKRQLLASGFNEASAKFILFSALGQSVGVQAGSADTTVKLELPHEHHIEPAALTRAIHTFKSSAQPAGASQPKWSLNPNSTSSRPRALLARARLPYSLILWLAMIGIVFMAVQKFPDLGDDWRRLWSRSSAFLGQNIARGKSSTTKLGRKLAAVLSSPAPSALGSVSLKWTPIPGAQSYLVQLSSDMSFEKDVADLTSSTNDYTWNPTEPGRFYWRVRAYFEGGQASPFSTIRETHVRLAGLMLPDEVSARIQNRKFLFTWPSSPAAAAYSIMVSRRPDFSVYESLVVSESRAQVPANKSGEYFIKVIMMNAKRQVISWDSNVTKVTAHE